MQDNPKDSLKITAITPAQAAKVLSTAYKRRIEEDQIRHIVEEAQILRADDTFSLIEYAAWLAGGGGEEAKSGVH